ncbi:DUF3887 domain-containing protein [Oceanobacillus sp. FSL K6-2867]|uniref:DUF3887 domain-containing protein n=1 Tax=Oceanobacillus sp. FSL K6-2867 TaxID=2954748 RepID=UPI0030DD28EE
MKKLLFILLALFVLVGCNENEAEPPETDEQTTEANDAGEQTDDKATNEGTDETNHAAATDSNGTDADSEGNIALAEEFIEQLANEEFEAATAHFNDMMAVQLTPVALDELWVSLQDQLGGFIDQQYSSTEEVDDHQVVLIDGLFESADVVFSLAFDNNNQIAGFYIQ